MNCSHSEKPQLLFIIHFLLLIFLAVAPFPVSPEGGKAFVRTHSVRPYFSLSTL